MREAPSAVFWRLTPFKRAPARVLPGRREIYQKATGFRMKQNGNSLNKKYILLLIGVVLAGVAAWQLTGGALDLAGMRDRDKAPTDAEENLLYGLSYQPSSSACLERDGIVLKNFGGEIRAVELSSGIQVDAGGIAGRSDRPIVRFSEYVSYLYMYDGQTVYRTQIGGDGKVHTAVEDCLKFEPMGNYLYSLKEYKGQTWLYRCSILGTYEKRLFEDPVEDFWAYGGDLLLLDAEGRYRWYDTISGDGLEQALPVGARDIALDSEGILYLLDEEGGPALYRRQYTGQTERLLDGPVAGFSAGPGGIVGLLLEGEDGCAAAVCRADGGLVELPGRRFDAGSVLDVSPTQLLVTGPDGVSWHTPIAQADWAELF